MLFGMDRFFPASCQLSKSAKMKKTERFFSVSPNVSRSDSSNLNPQEFWNHGIQMVGINYQTPGLMVDLQVGYGTLAVILSR